MGIKKTFITNSHGIEILRCCASCGHRKIDKYARRCAIDGAAVPSGFLCSEWVLNPTLDNAGKGDGKVKRREYLQLVIDRIFGDDCGSSIMDLRTEFKRKHGGIYSIEE